MKSSIEPKVSVLMSVYNGKDYLKEAIDSILGQTFTDFEFIIVNDGSTDSTREILDSYSDERIVVVNNESNLGLPASLNEGIRIARGDYIIRMDADDISLPDRIKVQFEFMESNPDIDVCGTPVNVFGALKRRWYPPTNHEDIVARFLFESNLYHPTVIIRRDLITCEEFYNLEYIYAQDYDLWVRLMIKGATFANIKTPLVLYRTYNNQKNKTSAKKNYARDIRVKYIKELGVDIVEKKIEVHELLLGGFAKNEDDFDKVIEWMEELVSCNEKSGLINKEALEKELLNRWFYFCSRSSRFGLCSWHIFNRSYLAKKHKIKRSEKLSIALKEFVKKLINYDNRRSK